MKLFALNMIKYIDDKGVNRTAYAEDVFDLSEEFAADLIRNNWAREATTGEIAEASQDAKFAEAAKTKLPVPKRAAKKEAGSKKEPAAKKEDGKGETGSGEGKGRNSDDNI